mmetsp:Transcript_13696/g.41419  ORF Transcript_13696/g.41419 Transcript_13696/m.41419 type:complete len:421 (-) Transcript_13696:487-1749(-)
MKGRRWCGVLLFLRTWAWENRSACWNVRWCDAQRRAGRAICPVSGVTFRKATPEHDVIEFELEVAFDEKEGCASGYGATLRVETRGPSFSIAGARATETPGVYVARPRIGAAGTFHARAILDLDRCEATTHCDPDATALALREVATTTVVVHDVRQREWWSRERSRHLQWQPPATFDAAKLQGWVHFVGMSTSRMLLYDVVRVLQSAGHEPQNWRPDARRCDRFDHPDVTFPTLRNFRLTLLCHDLGMEKRYDTASSSSSKLFSWEMNATRHFASLQTPRHSRPDLVLLNKGIHVAEYVANPQVLEGYRDSVKAHLDGLSSAGTRVLWRRSLPTHFRHPGRPHPAWHCRLWERLDCLNSVVDDLRPFVTMLDFWDLALSRPDCTRDNRHYTHANCGDTMARLFLQALTTDASLLSLDHDS